MDFEKRKFIKTSTAVCASGLFLSSAQADPIIVGSLIAGVVASVVSGLYTLSAKNKEAELAIATEQKRIVLQKIDYLFKDLPMQERLALMQNGTYMNAVLTGNLDGFSSMLALKDGQLYVARDYIGEKIHSDMARPMQVVMNETGRLPIPTGHLKATEYRQGTGNATAYIANKMGINQEEYLKNRAPKIISPMSLARSPRQGGEDFAFLTTLNHSNGYVSNGKQYAALEVNPVPMKVMRG